jgi:hypothetical protein
MPDVQRVRDRPAEEEAGANEVVADEPAERQPITVRDPRGQRVGTITDAAPGLVDQPSVVLGLDEQVREELGLATRAVDIEARFLERTSEREARLTEPLAHVLRAQGFDL